MRRILNTKKLILCLLIISVVFSLSACGGKTFKKIEDLGTQELCLAFRYEDKLADTLSAALSEVVASGTATRLSATYFGEDLISSSGDSNAIVNLDEIAERRTLIMGVVVSGAPYAYYDGRELTGFVPELARAIASEIGWDITFQEITNGDACAQLGSGNIDCAVCVPSSLFSDDKYSKSEVIMTSDYVIASSAASTKKSLRSLKNETIALVEGDSLSEKLVNGLDEIEKFEINIKYYKNAEAVAKALLKDDVQAAAMDEYLLNMALLQ